MLREEQIDIRRQRARAASFQIRKLGRNRVFSDYQVSNPKSGGQYTVSIRGFETGDNTCTCPDFRSNTLGTCKHIEAVLETLKEEAPPHLRQRKAAVTRPEVFLHYGEHLQIGLHLPPRHSDQLSALAQRFFEAKGYWKNSASYEELIAAVESVPEQVVIFTDAMEFMDREIERQQMAKRERELLEEMRNAECGMRNGSGDSAILIPNSELNSLLKTSLYRYQLEGAIFLACRGRCILGDDMGLGKTVQAMAAVELLVRERGIERVLVVAPASVKYQWETEIRRFTDRPVQVIEGGQETRLSQYSEPAFYRLVNYEQVLRDLEPLNAWQPDLIILDEAQRIKNWESKISRAVKKLRSRYAFVLTGTPLENRLEELYSIVQFVDDRRLGPPFQFLHEHLVMDDKYKLLGYRNLDKVREKLAPILLRRTRGEVLQQLPERTDSTLYVEMTAEQRGPYEEQRTALARLLQKKILTDLDRRRILCCIANLRMLCDSTWLFDKKTNVSPKLEEFAELVQELGEEGAHKAVVFSQWEMMLEKASERLRQLKIEHAFLHGRIPSKDRKAILQRFHEDPACRVLLSTDAGGTGLNLQVADTVINLEIPWNPGVLEQRIGRVHRMGQSNPVRVILLVTRGSIEERVLRTIEMKRSLFAGVFDGESDEVCFHSLARPAFLESVREMIGEPSLEALEDKETWRQGGKETSSPADARINLLLAGVQFLEALGEVMAQEGANGLPPEISTRAGAAVRRILQGLDAESNYGVPGA
ncbi:MAG TPA: DEAD/DEAH box helicase [Gemmataceae bacterium]|nr:DEAD/DEAH box helicase [Gemmataceae bacterium]